MKSAKSLLLLSLIVLTASAMGIAQPAPKPAEKPAALAIASPWTTDDILLQETAGSYDISPDGKWAVWVKSAMDKDKDGRVNHIYLTSLTDKPETITLTRGDGSEFAPKWSPSGATISFLASRKEKADAKDAVTQVWMMDRRGGEPWAVTNLEPGVIDYDWIDEGRLLLLARELPTLLELTRKERKDTAYNVEDQEHMPPQRLFIFDIKAKKAERLTQNKDEITNYALSHDKKWVLTRNNQSVRFGIDKKIKPRFFLVSLTERSSTELFNDPFFKPNQFEWAMDDKGFYFSVTRTSDKVNDMAGADFLYYYDLAGRTYAEVPLDWDRGLFFFGFQARENGFVASLANGATPKWRRYVKSGLTYSHQDIEGKNASHIYGFVFQQNGDVALYRYSTAMEPAQWFWAALAGNVLKNEKRISDLNASFKDKTKAKAEVITWKGALDETIEGLLFYPQGFKEGTKYPLVLMIHGGPTGADMDAFDDSWAYSPNLMAQKGAFVLQPNYHGSAGYGQAFAESIKGHYYELEIPDIMNGVDELIKKGWVDPDRLGTIGWSNGGILSIALTTWTKRFKAAGVGAADVNWTSDYGNCAFGVCFDNYYFKGAPWDQIEHYIQKSPLFHLKDMKVPTIIFHGTEDTSVPYEQGWEYYRALQQIGQAPVRFIVFPGEPHGLGKYTHQSRKMTEEAAWFDRYLFKTEKPSNEALKKGSPLDTAIKMAAFPRSGGNYGLTVKGALIPETLAFQGMEVGRFEVTRAQWAAFDGAYKYEPGTGNYPVTRVTFDQAGRYVKWLSGLTGATYRLPKAEEAEKLSKAAAPGDNTLDYWAGYSLGPDDAALLLAKVKEMAGSASLLLPVDKFSPSSEEMVFGLGGNAAEWAVDDKGAGKVVGRSAVTATDSPGTTMPPPSEYVGLRVIKGK